MSTPTHIIAPSELKALTASLSRIAQDAGQAIMQIYAQAEIAVTDKADHSPLTQADLLAHQCIAAGLAALTPQIPVVSEEDAASLAHRSPVGRHWLIDPLDGTKEFLARTDEFTVNIALVQDSVAVLGVVYAPATGVLYWGGPALGAFRSSHGGPDEAIRVAPQPSPGQACRVVASKSHLNEETSAFIDRLGQALLIQAGSSLKFCRVAEGAADVYPRLAPTCEWDTAAAQAVVEGAGGVVLNLAGLPLRYGKPEVLNTSFVAASSAKLCQPPLSA